MKGWGPKSSVCPSKPRGTKLIGGIFRDFFRDIPGCPKSLRKKVCVPFLASIVTLVCGANATGKCTILFKIITHIKLLFSNCLGDDSNSFQGLPNSIALHLQFPCFPSRMQLQK